LDVFSFIKSQDDIGHHVETNDHVEKTEHGILWDMREKHFHVKKRKKEREEEESIVYKLLEKRIYKTLTYVCDDYISMIHYFSQNTSAVSPPKLYLEITSSPVFTHASPLSTSTPLQLKVCPANSFTYMIILHIIHLVIIIIIIFNVKMNFHAIGEEEGAERTTHAKEFKHMQQKSQYMFENKYWLANSFSFLFQLFFNLKNTDSPKNPHRMMDRY
jgi:hypothetical protein